MRARTLLVAFGTPPLRRCQFAAAAARLVGMAAFVAVATALYVREGAEAVAALAALRPAAAAIATPFVTAAAGHRRTSRLLVASALLAAAAGAANAFVLAVDGPAVAVLALSAVMSMGLAGIRPLVTALLPDLLDSPEELIATNASAGVVDGLATLLGPVLAGAGLVVADASAVLAAGALLCATIAVAAVAIPARPLLQVARPVGSRRPAWRDGAQRLGGEVRRGLVALLRQPGPRLVLGLVAAQTAVRGALNVLVVVLAVDALGLDEASVGGLLGAIGVGSLLGLPLAVQVGASGRMGRALGAGLLLWGLPVAALASVGGPTAAVVLLGVVGVGNTLVDLAADTLLQRLLTGNGLVGAMGAFESLVFVAMALGAVAAERLQAGFGLDVAFVVVGVTLVLLVALAAPALRHVDRRLASRDGAIGLLRLLGVFSPLVLATVDHLATRMTVELHPAGGTILRKGDAGDRFLVVERGEVEVYDDDVLLAVLGPSAGFGEMALLGGVPRNATVVARTEVRLRALKGDDFLAAVRSDTAAMSAAEQLVRERSPRASTAGDGVAGVASETPGRTA